jgi:hypothetical protein
MAVYRGETLPGFFGDTQCERPASGDDYQRE